jgi:hypothetical protein
MRGFRSILAASGMKWLALEYAKLTPVRIWHWQFPQKLPPALGRSGCPRLFHPDYIKRNLEIVIAGIRVAFGNSQTVNNRCSTMRWMEIIAK